MSLHPANDEHPHLPEPNLARNLNLLLANGHVLPEITTMRKKRNMMTMNDDPLGPRSVEEAVVAADAVVLPLDEDLPPGAETWFLMDDHDDQVPRKARLLPWAEDGQLLPVSCQILLRYETVSPLPLALQGRQLLSYPPIFTEK